MNKKMYSLSARLFSALLLLLGFSSCDKETPAEYGTPTATYKFRGSVVSKETNQPAGNVKVVASVRHEAHNVIYYERLDSTLTDSQGKIELDLKNVTTQSTFHFILSDENNVKSLESDTIGVTLTNLQFKGGSKWYRGEAQADLGTLGLDTVKRETEE